MTEIRNTKAAWFQSLEFRDFGFVLDFGLPISSHYFAPR
jgi:hypothetical protein